MVAFAADWKQLLMPGGGRYSFYMAVQNLTILGTSAHYMPISHRVATVHERES